MAPTERIRVRVETRSGITPAKAVDRFRTYTADRNPWSVRSRRPLVLNHASRRAEGVRFEFKPNDQGLLLTITGGGARLGLAYAATLLANAKFSDVVSSFEVQLP